MSSDANARRIIAYGLRNPFRLTIRPGTNDVWVADVGGGQWEEIDRIPDLGGPIRNFGWPCYQGGNDSSGNPTSVRDSGFDSLNVNMGESLYSEGPGAATAPYFAYAHSQTVVSGRAARPPARRSRGSRSRP